jgi:pantetheine-phosphate adenylyltransferase
MIEQGAALFDRLIVAVGLNPEKRYLFSIEDRLEMLSQCTTHLPNTEVQSFTNQFLINFAESRRARFILRHRRRTREAQACP